VNCEHKKVVTDLCSTAKVQKVVHYY